jgi:hypothetical protein
MTRTRIVLFVTALVAAVAIGAAGIAWAAPATTARIGGQVGGICRQAGVTIADVVAKATGQSVAAVRAQRAAGKTFAAIGAAKGVSAQQLTDATIAARKAALDAAVKSGRITAAQADRMLARMKTRVADRVKSAPPADCDGSGSGAGGGRGAGRGGGGGCQGGGCGMGATSTQAQ